VRELVVKPSAPRASLAAWLAVALAPLASAAASGHFAPVPAPSSDAPAVGERAGDHGIDVSHHDGFVDWPAVRASGRTFAAIKATEGVDDADPLFAHHWPLVAEAGLVRGAYHFYVTEDDPLAQAELFMNTVTLGPGDLPPIVDIEVIGRHADLEALPAKLHAFLDALEEHYGAKPIIYTNASFWNAHLDDSFSDHPLWIAEYGVDEPACPQGWEDWAVWQWKDDAVVPGVETRVDVNHGRDALDALRLPE